MNDNKVSEKAIWEGSITPDNDIPSLGAQMQSQPQMMFCYKCNNVIPGDSKYCPCCNIELYTTCPKCGVKYSSQYSICSQCGTNRVEFLEVQRREQERIERLKHEERIRQENLERKRQEVERKQKEAYLKENERIMKTKEYELTYSMLEEAQKAYIKKEDKIGYMFYFSLPLPTLWCFIPVIWRECSIFELWWGWAILIMLVLLEILMAIIYGIFYYSSACRENNIWRYISSKNNYDKEMITKDIIRNTNFSNLSDRCVIAYRKKYGLPINYEWHNLK